MRFNLNYNVCSHVIVHGNTRSTVQKCRTVEENSKIPWAQSNPKSWMFMHFWYAPTIIAYNATLGTTHVVWWKRSFYRAFDATYVTYHVAIRKLCARCRPPKYILISNPSTLGKNVNLPFSRIPSLLLGMHPSLSRFQCCRNEGCLTPTIPFRSATMKSPTTRSVSISTSERRGLTEKRNRISIG